MAAFLFLAPLIAQLGTVGPMVSPGAAPAITQPPLRGPNTIRRRGAPQPVAVAPDRTHLETCLAAVESSPSAAKTNADLWLKDEQGSGRAEPLLCLGSAEARAGDLAGAEAHFREGREIAASSDRFMLARLGAMAGNAALGLGQPARALEALDRAHADAKLAGEDKLAGSIALDRARALVALNRPDDAAAALAEARVADPADATAWLLSATLSRRTGKLAEAQSQIETAAGLDAADPAIGLEAGVIAAMLKKDDAARRSWRSVVSLAPESPEAATAREYLAQIGPDAAPGKAAPETGAR